MSNIVDLAIMAVQAFLLVLLVRAVLSWFPGRGGPLEAVTRRITEPVMGPVRRALPAPRIGGMGLDLSFIAVFFAVQLVVLPLLYSLR